MSLKRKLDPDADAFPRRGVSADLTPLDLSPQPKRRRCNTLERGFARLSMNHHTATQSQTSPRAVPSAQAHPVAVAPQVSTAPAPDTYPSAPPPSVDYAFEELAVDADAPERRVTRPGSVEEPSAPSVPEVRMKTSTWYEPEKDRVIVTDLDDSDEEEEDEGTEVRPESEIAVSSALLERLRESTRRTVLGESGAGSSADLAPRPSNALVLFRPPMSASLASREDEDEEKNAGRAAPRKVQPLPPPPPIQDDDAMDVDMDP